ncbi:amino acid synthesis family protein [Dactylosporangium roseum]|uniref:Amino acid synthesis family protein n=1 Tax=Dactylosporangium roseum TaxID=47989 RepID=A0ABY5ZAW1_9ACTN|nr:amino acid synthesis family protein [Dactylosporangium roseum]UWZ39235.1 amino acid synthesis family protein [Dactylosporangium roseum]
MSLEIRKIVSVTEDLHREGVREVAPPTHSAIVSAVIRNPWVGMGFVEDLDPVIQEVAPRLARIVVPELVRIMGGPENIEAYGKSATVGLAGEVEHASALIHTLRFGNVLRDQAAGTSFLSFTNKRGAAGATITIPLVHKTDRAERSHFLTVETVVPDAPMADEIVVSIAASSAGRPFARIGNRRRDVEVGAV